MARDPLDLPATPERLAALAAGGRLDEAALARAFELATASPPAAAWRAFVGRVLLLVGTALSLAGVVYFVAYNWAELGRFAKFALVETLIAGATLGALRVGLQRTAGRAALTAAAVLVGPLLAVYGQTYQTGADPYELFLAWALLIAPWVAVARFTPLVLLFVVLADTAVVLWSVQVLDAAGDTLWLALFAIDGAAWLFFEVAGRRLPWAAGRAAPRLLATASFTALGVPTLVLIMDSHWFASYGPAPALLLLVLVPVTLYWFLRRAFDLFMLALALAAVMTIATTLV